MSKERKETANNNKRPFIDVKDRELLAAGACLDSWFDFCSCISIPVSNSFRRNWTESWKTVQYWQDGFNSLKLRCVKCLKHRQYLRMMVILILFYRFSSCLTSVSLFFVTLHFWFPLLLFSLLVLPSFCSYLLSLSVLSLLSVCSSRSPSFLLTCFHSFSRVVVPGAGNDQTDHDKTPLIQVPAKQTPLPSPNAIMPNQFRFDPNTLTDSEDQIASKNSSPCLCRAYPHPQNYLSRKPLCLAQMAWNDLL